MEHLLMQWGGKRRLVQSPGTGSRVLILEMLLQMGRKLRVRLPENLRLRASLKSKLNPKLLLLCLQKLDLLVQMVVQHELLVSLLEQEFPGSLLRNSWVAERIGPCC